MEQQYLMSRILLRIGVDSPDAHLALAQRRCMRTVSVFIAIALLSFSPTLSSCTPNSDRLAEPSTESRPVDNQPVEPIDGASPTTQLPPSTEPSEALESEASMPNSSQLPTAVRDSVLQEISISANAPIDSLEIESAVQQSWPDGCLGLGGPDDICTFAIVEGWEVTVSQDNNVWIYRTDSDGFVVKEDTEKR